LIGHPKEVGILAVVICPGRLGNHPNLHHYLAYNA
jgi:hypothetical protein